VKSKNKRKPSRTHKKLFLSSKANTVFATDIKEDLKGKVLQSE